MSTPWSGDQVLGGAATDLGTIGNTNPCPAPIEFSSWTILSSRLTSASEGGRAFGSPTGYPPWAWSSRPVPRRRSARRPGDAREARGQLRHWVRTTRWAWRCRTRPREQRSAPPRSRTGETSARRHAACSAAPLKRRHARSDPRPGANAARATSTTGRGPARGPRAPAARRPPRAPRPPSAQARQAAGDRSGARRGPPGRSRRARHAVGIEQQRDVDAVSGHERQPLEQLAPCRDLAGQRLPHRRRAPRRTAAAAAVRSAR